MRDKPQNIDITNLKDNLENIEELIKSQIKDIINPSINMCSHLSYNANKVKIALKSLDEGLQKHAKNNNNKITIPTKEALTNPYNQTINPNSTEVSKHSRKLRIFSPKTKNIVDKDIKDVANKIKLYADYMEDQQHSLEYTLRTYQNLCKAIEDVLNDMKLKSDSISKLNMPSNEELEKIWKKVNKAIGNTSSFVKDTSTAQYQ